MKEDCVDNVREKGKGQMQVVIQEVSAYILGSRLIVTLSGVDMDLRLQRKGCVFICCIVTLKSL